MCDLMSRTNSIRVKRNIAFIEFVRDRPGNCRRPFLQYNIIYYIFTGISAGTSISTATFIMNTYFRPVLFSVVALHTSLALATLNGQRDISCGYSGSPCFNIHRISACDQPGGRETYVQHNTTYTATCGVLIHTPGYNRERYATVTAVLSSGVRFYQDSPWNMPDYAIGRTEISDMQTGVVEPGFPGSYRNNDVTDSPKNQYCVGERIYVSPQLRNGLYRIRPLTEYEDRFASIGSDIYSSYYIGQPDRFACAFRKYREAEALERAKKAIRR